MIQVAHRIDRDDLALGIVRAEPIEVHAVPPSLNERLDGLLQRRREPLQPYEEQRRRAARDMLRNGRYKPTGRGKPASEYLVRAATRDDRSWPRINGPVDVCNFISLGEVIPVSLWDLDRAESERFVFRLGHASEAFVFNQGGQTIDLEDLVVGCRRVPGADEAGEPIVNPVKDSLATKTTERTRRVAACVYAPLVVIEPDALRDVCSRFATLLSGCGEHVETAFDVVLPGETKEI